MRAIVISMIILFGWSHLAGQSVSHKVSFDPSGKIYNKHTGKKVSDEEFSKYITDNPRVSFEHEIDKYGEVARYLLDTTTREVAPRTEEDQTKPGEPLPEFVFTSMTGETVASEELKGQWIVLKFEIFLPMLDVAALKQLDTKIESMSNKEDFVMIDCFIETADEINSKIDGVLNNIFLVSDAMNFQLRYSIVRYPQIILIDPQGIVVGYYSKESEIDWSGLTVN